MGRENYGQKAPAYLINKKESYAYLYLYMLYVPSQEG